MESNLIYFGMDPQKHLPINHYLVPGIFGLNQDSRTILFNGGQSVVFFVKNVNILPVTIEISPNQHFMNSVKTILIPQMTYVCQWTIFCEEPKSWSFDISSISDAIAITIQIYSTWVHGMQPNPYKPKDFPKDNKKFMELLKSGQK